MALRICLESTLCKSIALLQLQENDARYRLKSFRPLESIAARAPPVLLLRRCLAHRLAIEVLGEPVIKISIRG